MFQRDSSDSSGGDDSSIDEFTDSDVESDSSEDSILSIAFDDSISDSDADEEDDELVVHWAAQKIVLDRIEAPDDPEDVLNATYRVTMVTDPMQTRPKKSEDPLERMEAEMEKLEHYRKKKIDVPKERYKVVKMRQNLRTRSPLQLTDGMKDARRRLRNRNG